MTERMSKINVICVSSDYESENKNDSNNNNDTKHLYDNQGDVNLFDVTITYYVM